MKKIRKLLITLVLKLLEKELEVLPHNRMMTAETRRTFLSRAYQNPALLEYFEYREALLLKQTFNLFANNEIDNARGVVGQVYELRALQNTLRVCYTYKREDRNRSPKSMAQRGQTRNRPHSLNATAVVKSEEE
jgi:hypothetical protein